MDCGNILIRVI